MCIHTIIPQSRKPFDINYWLIQYYQGKAWTTGLSLVSEVITWRPGRNCLHLVFATNPRDPLVPLGDTFRYFQLLIAADALSVYGIRNCLHMHTHGRDSSSKGVDTLYVPFERLGVRVIDGNTMKYIRYPDIRYQRSRNPTPEVAEAGLRGLRLVDSIDSTTLFP